MVFHSNTYSVLLVSASEKMNTAMASALPSTDFWPVRTVRSISQARRLTLENPFDLILVNAPLPDGGELPFCIDVSSNSESAVLLLVRGEDYEETYYEALPHGVMTLSRPVSRARPVWRFVGEAGAAGGDAVFLQIAPGAGCRVDVEALLAEHLAGRQQVGFLDGVAR